MDRPFQVGDFVLVGFGDSSSYQAKIIGDDGIYISPVDDPNTLSKLAFDPIKRQWMVFSSTQDFKLEFISKDKYDELNHTESLLLVLSKDSILDIGLN